MKGGGKKHIIDAKEWIPLEMKKPKKKRKERKSDQ